MPSVDRIDQGLGSPELRVARVRRTRFTASVLTLSAYVSSFRILLLTPINSNTFRLYFSTEPWHSSTLAARDSLLRTNYAFSIGSGDATAPVVEGVENPQPRPDDIAGEPGAWSVDLRLDRRILARAIYELEVSNVLGIGGESLTVDEAEAPGISRPRELVQPTSPQFLPDPVDFFYDTFEGVFRLDSRNDLALHGGVDTLKKRIIRRILSSPGGFSHLPAYGVGLRVKQLLSATARAKLRADILRQVRQEPDVEEATVEVAVQNAIVFVSVSVRPRSRSPVSVSLSVSDVGVVVL